MEKHDFDASVDYVVTQVYRILVDKNEKYGDAAFDPVRIFSSSSSLEQLRVRIDDKLSRIQASRDMRDDEDTLLDLIGYLVLYYVHRNAITKADPRSGKAGKQEEDASGVGTGDGEDRNSFSSSGGFTYGTKGKLYIDLGPTG